MFIDDERSVEQSQSREGIEIILPAVTYRIATGTRDITINGARYTATAVNRGAVSLATSERAGDLEVALPVSHPVAQRYLAGGVPPRQIIVKVWRVQSSGAVERLWEGQVTSMAISGHVAKFLVPARMTEAMVRRLPTITVGRACPHVLFDQSCTVDRNLFKAITTVTSIDGRTIKADIAMDDQWARFGELLHVASGERMTIISQASSIDLAGPHIAVEIQLAIYGVAVGDAIEIYSGCDHRLFMCRNKFSNVLNFGGFPRLGTINPFNPTGFGLHQTD